MYTKTQPYRYHHIRSLSGILVVLIFVLWILSRFVPALKNWVEGQDLHSGQPPNRNKTSRSDFGESNATLASIKELRLKEHSTLRDELNNLKNCQITFLTFSVTATGALLSVVAHLNTSPASSPPPLGAYYLVPLVILLPFWWIFFDKATTITRVVGYYRILENDLRGSEVIHEFVGWETALARFRQQQRQESIFVSFLKFVAGCFGLVFIWLLWFLRILPIPPIRRAWQRASERFNILILQTPHKYWIITYYTYLSLSLLCRANPLS